MTEGNRKRLRQLTETLKELSDGKQDAQHAALTLLIVQGNIATILTDLVLRPEVNS